MTPGKRFRCACGRESVYPDLYCAAHRRTFTFLEKTPVCCGSCLCRQERERELRQQYRGKP